MVQLQPLSDAKSECSLPAPPSGGGAQQVRCGPLFASGLMKILGTLQPQISHHKMGSFYHMPSLTGKAESEKSDGSDHRPVKVIRHYKHLENRNNHLLLSASPPLLATKTIIWVPVGLGELKVQRRKHRSLGLSRSFEPGAGVGSFGTSDSTQCARKS